MGKRGRPVLLGAASYQTYGIVRPVNSHFRKATCEEIDCPNYLFGWKTLIDEATELGKRQAEYIRKHSGRKFQEMWDGGLTTFVFEAGQRCFSSDDHKKPLDREPIYLVKGGDRRGDPRRTAPRIHKRADDWVDDFANHQDKLSTQLDRG